LRFYQKTRGDLIKQPDLLRTYAGSPEQLTGDELSMVCRDIRRTIDLLNLANELLEKQRQENEGA
jgi:hypothetical protein